ncbi:hypothetical protein [Brachybacterium phenoliresistens]|uniref:hypothetical protein n=1 Tax=Brachybacterium phenoliresistens TaxID=396014 RepID=UPI0031D7C33C
MSYKVTAPVVKVSIGSLDGNRVARILRAGAIVPEGVAEESLDLLASRGLIEALPEPDLDPEDDIDPETLGDAGAQGEERPTPPPKAGKGSGPEAWRAYAEKVDVEVPADASREDVIAAVDAAGKPTE